MNTTLEVIDPSGQVARPAMDTQRTEIDAAPGHIYRIHGGQNAGLSPRAVRVGGDLILQGLPDGQELVIVGFFTACRPGDVCTVILDEFAGLPETSITPATRPMGALSNGDFLIFSADQERPVAGAPGPATSAGDVASTDAAWFTGWKPVAAVGGGLLIIGGAAAGSSNSVGSDVARDTEAPTAPVVDANPALDDGFLNRGEASAGLTLTGQAEPGSTVTVNLTSVGGFALALTGIADDSGRFSIALPAGRLPQSDGNYSFTVTATDAAGNVSDPAAGQLTVDRTPPTATANISAAFDDFGGGATPVLPGGTTDDPTPIIFGTVSRALTSDESVVVLRNGSVIGTATVTGNQFTFTDPGAPSGSVSYTVQVRDTAGNGSTPSTALAFTIDAEPAGIGPGSTLTSSGSADQTVLDWSSFATSPTLIMSTTHDPDGSSVSMLSLASPASAQSAISPTANADAGLDTARAPTPPALTTTSLVITGALLDDYLGPGSSATI